MDGHGFLSPRIIALAAFIILLFFGGIGLYLYALNEPISSVRATRPILVFTLIVAMLGFGGLLMVSSLFGSAGKDELEYRFRLAREIFLVYAGIFGTIIGFYFGAADEKDVEAPPSVRVEVTRSELTAQVTGGAPPFIGYVTREGPPLNALLRGAERLLSLRDDDADGIACPMEATVVVVDGRGRRATVDIKNEMVKAWPECSGKQLPEFAAERAEQAANGL